MILKEEICHKQQQEHNDSLVDKNKDMCIYMRQWKTKSFSMHGYILTIAYEMFIQ